MYVKYLLITVFKSVVSNPAELIPAWMLPLYQFKFPGSINVIAEQWLPKEFPEGPPEPAAEYQRLTETFGRDDGGIPYAQLVFGNAFDLDRSLAPLMKDSITRREQDTSLRYLDQRDKTPPPPKPDPTDEEDEDDDLDNIEMPASIDPDGNGYVKKSNALIALASLGVDPDPEWKADEVREVLESEVNSMLKERNIEIDKEANIIDRWGLLFQQLQAEQG